MKDFYPTENIIPSCSIPEIHADRYGSTWKITRRDILPGDEAIEFWNNLPEEVKAEIQQSMKEIFERRVLQAIEIPYSPKEKNEHNTSQSSLGETNPRGVGYLRYGSES